jgi:hypothetical protein
MNTSKRAAVRGGAGIVVLVAQLWTALASAEGSPYCEKVHERAADDAAILMGPRVSLQGLRFPENGQLAGGTVVSQGFQTRAGLTFSATDLYKGFGVLRVGEADCREHEARAELAEALAEGDDDARRAALQAQIAFLEAHADEVQGWVDRAAARFANRLITLVELEDVRTRAAALERKLMQARGQARELVAKGAPAGGSPAPSVDRLASAYADAAADLERATSRARSSEPWQLEMTGGVVTYPRVDWYGVVQLGFNLGGLARGGHAERHERARKDEIARASYETDANVRRSHELLAVKLEEARLELALLQRELTDLQSTRKGLEGSEAPNVVHQRERLALEQVGLEAEQAFRRAYVDRLGAIVDYQN